MAIPIPNEGVLTPEQREAVRAALAGYLAKHDVKQNEVAKACAGINPPIVNGILKNTYNHGPLDDHLRALNNWMETDARRRQGDPGKKPLTTTFVVQLIRTAVDLCRKNCTLGYVTGPAGVGKTATAREIAKHDPGCVYLNINSFNATRASLLRSLCETLKVSVSTRRKNLRGVSTFERLRSVLEGSHRLLILDDADKLRDNSLETVRELHDAFEIPILLIGVKDIAERIRQSTDEDHGQLESRFGVKFDVRRARTEGERGHERERPIFTADEIRKILTVPGLRFTPGAIAYLKSLANQNGLGAIRRCEHLVHLASRVARKKSGVGPTGSVTLSEADLHYAARHSDVMRFDDGQDKRFKEARAAARTA